MTEERINELAAFRLRGLVGFLCSEPTSEAAPDHVASGAPLLGCERVEALSCLGADSDAAHLSGAVWHAIDGITVLDIVSQRDTVMA